MLRLITIGCFVALCSCGPADTSTLSGSSGSSSGSGSDGRHHPEPNGVHITETEACTLLKESFQSTALALNCSKTIRPCPAFVQVQYEPDCMEFDEGSVLGCVEFFEQIDNCADLIETQCIATAYPETTPQGCP